MTYYNELDKKTIQWLQNIAAAGHIGQGFIDGRDIREVGASDIAGHRRAHFFAGIAGWELALQIAGWPADRTVWTGSCPCQPFSVAGKQRGVSDERHVWPAWRRLISECRPPIIFGEQVSSKAGRSWLVGVRADLEALGYAVGAADLCAAGVGSPNIRQRLWWVAISNSNRPSAKRADDGQVPGFQKEEREPEQRAAIPGRSGKTRRLDNGNGARREGLALGCQRKEEAQPLPVAGCADRGLGDGDGHGLTRIEESNAAAEVGLEASRRADSLRPGYWSTFDLIGCLDGKARRIEPGTAAMAARLPGHMVKLRAYGNSINPWLAAIFIRSVMDLL